MTKRPDGSIRLGQVGGEAVGGEMPQVDLRGGKWVILVFVCLRVCVCVCVFVCPRPSWWTDVSQSWQHQTLMKEC